MNDLLRTALADPCYEAEETAASKFNRRMDPPNDHLTVVLTANIGLE